MATTTISNTLLNLLRQQILEPMAYAQYKIGSTWYRAEITSKEIRSNGAVHITFYLKPTATLAPATQFRLYNASGTLLAERTENIPFITALDVQYRFKFGLSVNAA